MTLTLTLTLRITPHPSFLPPTLQPLTLLRWRGRLLPLTPNPTQVERQSATYALLDAEGKTNYTTLLAQMKRGDALGP